MKSNFYFYHSPMGWIEIQTRGRSIYSVSRHRVKTKPNKKDLTVKPPDFVQKLFSFFDNYFAGKKLKAPSFPLFDRGTVFQKKVWKSLQRIPYGKTKTYSQIAASAGCPKAYRAAGSACGKNPWLIVVPCHRATAQSSLGGFALGLKIKNFLLHLEK